MQVKLDYSLDSNSSVTSLSGASPVRVTYLIESSFAVRF